MSLKKNKNLNSDANIGMHKVSVNVSAKHIRNDNMNGQDYIVVPLVMAIDGVVMNEALVPQEEFCPEAWNGRPVTIGHPQVNGMDVSANDPDILQKYSVGQLFNCKIEDGKLKAEAWVDPKRCEAISQAGVVAMLRDKTGCLDVSTGYFCEEQKIKGSSKGKEYFEIHRDLKPDHLALLPNEEGACNWADGCGVRANKKSLMTQAQDAIKVIANALNLNNHLEDNSMEEDEKAKLVDGLIGNEENPFGDGDKEALMGMSDDTLTKLAATPKGNEEDEPKDNEEGEDKKPAGNSKDKDESGDKDVKANLSKEDKDALAFASNLYKDHRDELVKKITGNSAMKEDDLKSMATCDLEVVANGILPEANYGGRAISGNGRSSNADEMAKSMTTQSTTEILKSQKEEA